MNPNQFNLRQRVLLATGIVLVVFLILLAITRLFDVAEAQPRLGNVPPLCANDPKETEQARALVLHGLDNALSDHAEHLLSVWIRDDVNQSTRAATGLQNGVRAYFHARRVISGWVIPPCKGEAK